LPTPPRVDPGENSTDQLSVALPPEEVVKFAVFLAFFATSEYDATDSTFGEGMLAFASVALNESVVLLFTIRYIVPVFPDPVYFVSSAVAFVVITAVGLLVLLRT
jgi:hypothetical protein